MPDTKKNFDYSVPTPVFRRLRGYAFDPSLSLQLDTAFVNEVIFKTDWEDNLEKGPIGEYLEVIDYDPASGCFYEPVDLNDPHILAQDGLSPSEGNPQFHQQMVYAVAMTTIKHFEKALGRKALWSSHMKNGYKKVFTRRLRMYPHALRQANAYYSPKKKSLLFGYFPATAKASGNQIPGGMVFTCLSHDIITHETTHALLDGMHSRFVEATHPDSLAFHEAFADIVAIFQHFTFPEVVHHQIAQTQGNLDTKTLLSALGHQFGNAIGNYGALRDYIEKKPDPSEYQERVKEPHDRGAILVAAIFDAFLAIYKSRISDLLRIATNGTGLLEPGAIHPDLVKRLADEATKTAQHILNMCIRALDYCPPVDINFGDYLRALITADTDLVPNDDRGYRIALIDAFRKRGIYPRDTRTLSEESLCWTRATDEEQQGIFSEIAGDLRDFISQIEYVNEMPEKLLKELLREDQQEKWSKISEREKTYILTHIAKAKVHNSLANFKEKKILSDQTYLEKFNKTTGLYLGEHLTVQDPNYPKVKGLRHKSKRYVFEVHSLRGARRIGPDGNMLNQVIISISQTRDLKELASGKFRGGCTLILDLKDMSLRYSIKKDITDNERLKRQIEYQTSPTGLSLRNTYFGLSVEDKNKEPFSFLHDYI